MLQAPPLERVHHLERQDWLETPADDPRGYIQPERLDELWFHTGSTCNLSCHFCLEGSRPGDNRIERIDFDDAKPFIDEAVALGVKKFSFTGGEPFVNRHLVAILAYALQQRPCLVLTNATEPLANRFAEIMALGQAPNPVSFRASLDYPDAERHDAARGKGNFRQTLTNLARLHRSGFGVSVARLQLPDEDAEAVTRAYQTLFAEAGLPQDLVIVAFPEFFPPGSLPDVPQITENCMTTYLDARQRSQFMCNYSKMIVKKGGKTGVYACTLVDDADDFSLGSTLTEAMKVRVMLAHHRCYSCFRFGASCSEGH